MADFISGVMQTRSNASLSHSDTADLKHEFIVRDDCDACHFFSQFRIVKKMSSGHGFVI